MYIYRVRTALLWIPINIKKMKFKKRTTLPQRKRFRRRSENLFKKANELHQLCDVKLFIVVEDPHSGRYQIFRTTKEKSWPPTLEEMNKMFPVPKIISPHHLSEEEIPKHRRTYTPAQKKERASLYLRHQSSSYNSVKVIGFEFGSVVSSFGLFVSGSVRHFIIWT
ncbi:hypothetical protein BDD12DRAFT_913742 [Trichophaea hybrida]|nr:hypothetical protein BDD12DRAFT_913742 [Trichophaea hybrida]